MIFRKSVLKTICRFVASLAGTFVFGRVLPGRIAEVEEHLSVLQDHGGVEHAVLQLRVDTERLSEQGQIFNKTALNWIHYDKQIINKEAEVKIGLHALSFIFL